MRSQAPADRIRLVYILAASHSGTTLLALLLNAHAEICSLGELKATSLGDVSRYRCSCRKVILECPFWNRLARVMRHQGFAFDISRPGTDMRVGASLYIRKLLQPLHRGPLLELLRDALLQLSPQWPSRMTRVQSVNAALMRAGLATTRKTIIVDSSKIGIRLKYLLRDQNLDVRIIRMVRDGRAVSLTYMDPAGYADARDLALRGGGSGGDRRQEALSIEQAAREWRRSNEEAQALLAQTGAGRWIGIRYEDLCREPESILKKIFDFLEVAPEDFNPNFRAAEHHVLGNGMRLDRDSEIKLDERWKTALTASELAIFERTAGRLNRNLGYA
jgi:hypothetical protein